MQNGIKPISSAFGDISSHFKIRSSLIQAIVQAECDYVKILNFVATVVKPSLEFCAEQIEYEIEDGHLRAIFGNIAELLQIHLTLKSNLESEIETNKSGSSIYTNEEQSLRFCKCCIGKIFLKTKDEFKAYDIYCSNHGRAEEVAKEILKMTSLSDVIKKWNDDFPFPGKNLNGESLLEFCIKEPLLYLCRMSVRLKVLSVFTMVNQTDQSNVLKAYSILHTTVTSIDPEKRATLLQTAYSLCDEMQEDWSNKGLLNKEGFLTKRGGSIKSWKIRWFTLRSYELKYFDEPVDEKQLGILNLRDCTKVFEVDNQSKPNCFGVTLPDRTYFIYAISPSEKMEWMNLIAWKIYMLLSVEEKARLAMSCPALGENSTILKLLNVN